MLLRFPPMRTPIDGPTTGNEQTAIGQPVLGKAVRYEIGAVLSGKYRLEALLGEGGMGAVWRATNVLLDLPVAIKLIRADLDREALRARLQLEARAAAKLGHPAIVRVFDVGESEFGDPFIVMEHLLGETLAQLLERGRLPATRAVQLLLPIIDALAVAHARGIVHRDLKPDNVMIALEEQHVRPKILDFGIAKLLDPCDSNLKLTDFGGVVGSPDYMSPEQARGLENIDASTDIWSICVVLYEAVTGSTPFSATNCNALLRSIVEDAPRPLSDYELHDSELWQILERGLHKERTQRYAKISELGQALARWLSNQGVHEDACGSSLDSKWLGRRNDSLSLGRLAPSSHSTPLQERPPSDSIPDSSAVVRGPFTQTLPPNAHGHPRRLGAAAAVCALLTLSLLAFAAFANSRRARASHSDPAAVAVASPLSAGAEPTAATPPLKKPITPPQSVPDSKPALTRAAASAVESVSKPKPAPARSSAPVSTQARRPSPASVPGGPAAAVAKADGPLDLLAPY